ncbi:MAG: hypothetical protein JWO33_966, partial [Caulobacteraceae bacterium]|nr:hypothetical protein [Caulobacteraceae bacterium]
MAPARAVSAATVDFLEKTKGRNSAPSDPATNSKTAR